MGGDEHVAGVLFDYGGKVQEVWVGGEEVLGGYSGVVREKRNAMVGEEVLGGYSGVVREKRNVMVGEEVLGGYNGVAREKRNVMVEGCGAREELRLSYGSTSKRSWNIRRRHQEDEKTLRFTEYGT